MRQYLTLNGGLMPFRVVFQFSSHMIFGTMTEPVPIASVSGRLTMEPWSPNRPFKIKCNATIEVWVWENSPPLQVASQIQLLAGEDRGEASRQQELGHITNKL